MLGESQHVSSAEVTIGLKFAKDLASITISAILLGLHPTLRTEDGCLKTPAMRVRLAVYACWALLAVSILSLIVALRWGGSFWTNHRSANLKNVTLLRRSALSWFRVFFWHGGWFYIALLLFIPVFGGISSLCHDKDIKEDSGDRVVMEKCPVKHTCKSLGPNWFWFYRLLMSCDAMLGIAWIALCLMANHPIVKRIIRDIWDVRH